MSETRLMLTCGLPGAGKTTLARQLAADRGALRLTKDEWLWALGTTPWDDPVREKVEQELWRLAQETLHLGLSVVVDFGLWARSERDEMRRVARGLGVGVELHYLDTPSDELWRRIEARNSAPPWDSYPIHRMDFDRWLCVFQAPDPGELALFDPPPDATAGGAASGAAAGAATVAAGRLVGAGPPGNSAESWGPLVRGGARPGQCRKHSGARRARSLWEWVGMSARSCVALRRPRPGDDDRCDD